MVIEITKEWSFVFLINRYQASGNKGTDWSLQAACVFDLNAIAKSRIQAIDPRLLNETFLTWQDNYIILFSLP